MTGLEILFLIMGILGVGLFIVFLLTFDEFISTDVKGYSIAIILMILLSLACGGFYGCHGYGYKTNKVEFQHINVIYSKELSEKFIIELEDKTVLVETELKWKQNLDNIYKKTTINNFGKKKIEYIVGNKIEEKE